MADLYVVDSIRDRFVFRNRPIKYNKENGTVYQYPCIVLVDKLTDINVVYTRLEDYVISWNHDQDLEESTLNKRTSNIVVFLNYLWKYKSGIKGIEDITQLDIRDFLQYSKKKDSKSKSEKKFDTWDRCYGNVIDFLKTYAQKNNNYIMMNIDPSDLEKRYRGYNSRTNSVEDKIKHAYFNVAPPDNLSIKNRVIKYDHLDMMLTLASIEKPELVLPIMLSAYAGLREGEIVNISRNSIEPVFGNVGHVITYSVNLKKDAEFNLKRINKNNTGQIKKKRIQMVYPAFRKTFRKAFEKQIAMTDQKLQSMGKRYDDDPEGPLLLNRDGNPLTVSAYSYRLKTFFFKNFIPYLEKRCVEFDDWEIHKAYIDKYKDEYPGAHMLRHWFTEHLALVEKLDAVELKVWRGDSSVESMADYLQMNDILLNMEETALEDWLNEVIRL